MRNAVVCLTRGYDVLEKYETLIMRNNAVHYFLGDKYDYVIYHEGNINREHQHYIQNRSNQKLIFFDISDVWTGGYEGMCRFYAFDIFMKSSQYDYILRVDEDCLIIKLDKDPFENIDGCVYAYSTYWGESHSETNATLPIFINSITGAEPLDFYNNKFPYTNIGLSDVRFFISEPFFTILKKISTCNEQKINRWGDLPIHGSLLNIFAKGKVKKIEGLEYHHISHNTFIK